MNAERPLGKIRMDRFRGNAASPQPAQSGRHRRPTKPDAEPAPATDTDQNPH